MATTTTTRKINLSLAHPGQAIRYQGTTGEVTRVRTEGNTTRVWVRTLVNGEPAIVTVAANKLALAYLVEQA